MNKCKVYVLTLCVFVSVIFSSMLLVGCENREQTKRSILRETQQYCDRNNLNLIFIIDNGGGANQILTDSGINPSEITHFSGPGLYRTGLIIAVDNENKEVIIVFGADSTSANTRKLAYTKIVFSENIFSTPISGLYDRLNDEYKMYGENVVWNFYSINFKYRIVTHDVANSNQAFIYNDGCWEFLQQYK